MREYNSCLFHSKISIGQNNLAEIFLLNITPAHPTAQKHTNKVYRDNYYLVSRTFNGQCLNKLRQSSKRKHLIEHILDGDLSFEYLVSLLLEFVRSPSSATG